MANQKTKNIANRKEAKETWKEKLASSWLTNFVAILAFVILVASLVTSCRANRIAKTAELPCFKFSMNFSNGQDEVVIHNEGGKLIELADPEVYLFWIITTDKTLFNTKEIVVLNYYNIGSRDPLLSNKTPAMISTNNSAKGEALIDGIKKLAKENNILVFVSAKKYIRLQYKDIYEELHDDMYEVYPFGSKKLSKKILKNEAVEVVKKYDQKKGRGEAIDISTASAEILYKIALSDIRGQEQ